MAVQIYNKNSFSIANVLILWKKEHENLLFRFGSHFERRKLE